METSRLEYEFLDLSDVKDAELSSLKCALSERPNTFHLAWAEPLHDRSSCSSSTAGPPTVSSSLDSLSGGECDMAPHSPPRAPPAPPVPAPPPPHIQQPPPPYGQPPPPYSHPPPHQSWLNMQPNVYVSQVTANVNVHGLGYVPYQPQQAQYGLPPQQNDRQSRGPRKNRGGKRVPSPPPQQYFIPYPQCYPAAQAQGAPLYHAGPVCQPIMYPYPYPCYYTEYAPMPVEEGEKGLEEQYPQEMMMEQEAIDAYFAGPHYGPGQPYPPPGDGMEYCPPVYMPPPPPHMQMPHPPPHHPPVQHHHLNVHAKNFIQNQNHKPFVPPEAKPVDPKPPTTSVPVASASAPAVDTLPIKDLKISTKEQESPKPAEKLVDQQQKGSPTSVNDKSPKQEANKQSPIAETQNQPAKSFQTGPLSVQPAPSSKVPQNVNKGPKGPSAPFAGAKQVPKNIPTSQTAISTQQPATTPKAPFPNRQRRDGPSNRSPENGEHSAPSTLEHPKREPPLPPSKAPVPISISLNAQGGAPLIVTNKPSFSHSRKPVPVEAPPAPQPPPPAPTSVDFPPPPNKHRGEPAPASPVQQPPPTASRSWASLFKASSGIASVSTPSLPIEEPTTPSSVPPPGLHRPIAKVMPYDASPVQQNAEKNGKANASVSYSEKTSANSGSGSVCSVSPARGNSEVREVPVVKESSPAVPVQPSPFADDPNSYRMGEFLSKYQLDNRTVNLLPRGLTNRSNFCYVNAILQALIACAPFYNMLKALPYQTRRGKSSTPVIDAMVELCYEFTPLQSNGRVSRSRGSDPAATATAALPVPTGPPLDSAAGQKVLRALRPFPGSQEGRQEDAEEFLGCLLNGLNDEMLELMKLVEPEEKEVAPAPEPVPEDEDDDEWKVMGPKNKGSVERSWGAGRTPLSDIFRGRTRCRLHRTSQQNHVTDAVQPFFTLQLDIERAGTVKDALSLLAGKDQLEDLTAGGARVEAWQQLSIEQLPVVLLLHLKCFQLDSDGHTAKIVKNVEFPVDLKIDTKIMSSKTKYSAKQRTYKLYAVVYHEGVEAIKGHYLTDTLHQSGWIRYDDSTVTHVTESQVLKPKAPRMPYLLMYRRTDTLQPAPHRPGKD